MCGESPDEEVGESTYFLSEEILAREVWLGGPDRRLDVGAELAGEVVVAFVWTCGGHS